MNFEKNNFEKKYFKKNDLKIISNNILDMNISNILKNKIYKQLNKYVTDKKTINMFSKHVQSQVDDKKQLKTFNNQLFYLQKYNKNNISSSKLLNKVKNHKNNYNLEVTMYVKKSYKQRDNTWTPMKLEIEPVVYSKPVYYAGSFIEAVNIIRDEAQHEGQQNDTWYVSQVNSIDTTSAVNTDSIGTQEPSNMFMRDSSPIKYNNKII